MALLNIGAVFIWGDNEYGQLGNKKRSFSNKPLILSPFKGKNVVDLKSDYLNNYVLVEKSESVNQS